jgi:predicted DNA binding CopG/RHH family protein
MPMPRKTKNVLVNLRIAAADREDLRRVAKYHGVTMGEWVRHQLHKEVRTLKRKGIWEGLKNETCNED